MRKIRIGLSGSSHYAIGLMSGTSHDGISAALVRIQERRGAQVKLLAFKTYPFASRFRSRLLRASAMEKVGTPEISTLNFGLGRALAHAALNLTRAAALPIEQVSFIGSHGHTFFHLPPRRAAPGEIPSTLQLGEPAIISALTGAPVVSDFRPMDMALGGEGAPLASLAHLRLFGDSERGRVIQNIGGIGNATYLPPGAEAGDPRRIAFDTGPGNGLIDGLVARLSGGRLRMDRDGKMARRGTVNQKLLDELMRHRYFRRRPPKSTGREEFGEAFLDRFEHRARILKLEKNDSIATITALTAQSIADACRQFVMPLGPLHQLVATGGGARNPALMRMIAAALPEIEVLQADQLGVNGDALEAVAFALLAYETLCGRPGNLRSVTGARMPAILGKITLPP